MFAGLLLMIDRVPVLYDVFLRIVQDAHIGRCTGIDQHVVLDQYSPISFHHPIPEAKTMMTDVVTSRKLSL